MTDLRKETERILTCLDAAGLKVQATHLRALQAEVDRLQAECEALRVDAGRYRWLRGDGGPASIRWPRWEVKHWSGVWNPVQKQDMDEAIDTAMNRERGG